MRTFNFGGGVQSTAALVLAAQDAIDFKTFLFANVGSDSENPATLVYMEQYAQPYAAAHGIELIELRRTWSRGERAGQVETLFGRLTKEGGASIPIPLYFSGGAPGSRACTSDFKIRVIARWQREHGATADNPAVSGLGISMDEIQRMRTDSGIRHQVLEYPLIDLRLNRRDCMTIIADAGLPVPPKSSCWFCPFHRHAEWTEMRRTQPELFERAVQLERRINEKRAMLGRDAVTLHPSGQPLDVAVGLQYALFEDEPCDSGYCFV